MEPVYCKPCWYPFLCKNSIYWEKKPLVVKAMASNKGRFDHLLSLPRIKVMTKKHPQYYGGRDLNVTKYNKVPDGVKRHITMDKVSADDEEQATASPAGQSVCCKVWRRGRYNCKATSCTRHEY
jgi:hypothetical protein